MKKHSEDNILLIEIKKRYFRPSELTILKVMPLRLKKLLKWEPIKDLDSLIQDMINYELNNLNNA